MQTAECIAIMNCSSLCYESEVTMGSLRLCRSPTHSDNAHNTQPPLLATKPLIAYTWESIRQWRVFDKAPVIKLLTPDTAADIYEVST